MARILLVGPDRRRSAGIRALLRQDGHEIVCTRSIADWRQAERSALPDLIVAAVASPPHMLATQGGVARGFPPPILFVEHGAEAGDEPYLEERLVHRIRSPFLGEELLAHVEALVDVRRVLHRGPAPPPTAARGGRWGRVGRRILDAFRTPARAVPKPREPFREVVGRLAAWAERRDAFRPGHADRVVALCAMMAEALRIEAEETEALLRAAAVHDIGKVILPSAVLHQREPLHESQLRLIRTHPQRGASLLRVLEGDVEVADTVLYHHERPDGSGYYGLLAERIPRTARILAVAEVYDAMTTSLVREPLSATEALAILESSSRGTHDADCVRALVEQLRPRPRSIPLVSQPDPAARPLSLVRGPRADD